MTGSRQAVLFAIIAICTGVLALFALVGAGWVRSNAPAYRVNQVAPGDIRAPQDFTYQSEVLTEQAREAAADAVPVVYSPPDASIVRQQVERLHNVLAYISSVRADEFASSEEKLTDLAALQDLHLKSETAQALLALNDTQWQDVQKESLNVLVQVMRGTIREDQLEDARRSIPALISLSLPEDRVALVTEISAAFIAPNSLYNEALTAQLRQSARENVAPLIQTYQTGETIVQRGDVLTPKDIESLTAAGLVEPQRRWQDTAGPALLVLVLLSYVFLFLRMSSHEDLDLRGLSAMAVLFLFFLSGARLLTPGHIVLPYVYPVAAFGLVVTAFYGANTGVIFSIPLAILAAYGYPNGLDLTLYYLLTSLAGIAFLRQEQRLSMYWWSGVTIVSTGIITMLAFRITQAATDWLGLLTLSTAALFNGVVAISVGLLLQFALAGVLGKTTVLHLIELSRPDNPLLQVILRNTPGTYQHSLQVANLAEQAAEAIQANALLTRVGALYHDAGKSQNPAYFIENQVVGSLNPHTHLPPAESAAIIIQHVLDGQILAQKYHLPARILDFIMEHHGTLLTRYQYVKAVEAADGDESLVDPAHFQYPGPSPRSRETAILMLADGCEARVRAEKPQTDEELLAIIKDLINKRLYQGQLDHTRLTLQDLDRIAESFAATLRGIYHPRIVYPKLADEDEQVEQNSLPSPATASVASQPESTP